MQLTTLCYIIRDGQVLLAMKKNGFGAGKWNGPGGKAKAGESAEETCIRETCEEVGIDVWNLEHRGIVHFSFQEKSEWDNECHIFVTAEYDGIPEESEEMKPRWFHLDDVPYADMWEDDIVWLPSVLQGGNVRKRFIFDKEGKMTGHEDLP